ncbi:FUSC family protein [Luteococcus peritonei]|uniref:Aromatic acid exporter family protein n=1 Tax=Luteococcus peritonei TaxID=88874 RepID=A0ABW4RTE8_9ACTN
MRTTTSWILDRLWPTRPSGWSASFARIVPVVGNMARLAIASTLAYLLTRWLVHGPIDLTAALTALLVMQASAAGSFKKGALRVVAVSSGVGMALLATGWLGMHWWSLGLVIFAALLLARMMRLGDSALEMPISAMLILGSTRFDVAAETRVISTLIGALVGVVFPLLLPPAVPYRSASASVRRVAGSSRDVLFRAADAMQTGDITKPMVARWLVDARRITGQIGKAHEQVEDLSDVRRFNSRAVGTADVSPILTSGLYTLENCLLSLRAIFMLMERQAPPVAEHPANFRADADRGFSVRIQGGVAEVLRRLGDCIEAFGTMVEAEANGNESKAHEVFAVNYRQLRNARAELASLMAEADENSQEWLLRGGILSALDQVLQMLDVDARVRVRQRWKASQLGRRLPQGQIGPRTTVMDRARHARLRARQLRRPEPTPTTADFLGDEEATQVIPIIRAEDPPPPAAGSGGGGGLFGRRIARR